MGPRTAAAIPYLVTALLMFGSIIVLDASLVVIVRGGLLVGAVGLCTDVGLILMHIGFTYGSATVASTLGVMYSVVAAVIGVVVLGENLTVTELTGIVFTVLGIVLVTR